MVTNPSSVLPDLDLAGVAAAYERRVRDMCPEHLGLALRLLERLPPTRWTLEWRLPWWLGQAFGLDPSVAREIVLSNVLGLGSIRLQDDLADGEVAPGEVDGARVLAGAMYEAALEPYRVRFDRSSPFWRHLDKQMAAWRAATDREGSPESRLAARGAPLHIVAAAVCLLSDRMEAYPALEACLDHALEALVLYDHLADWEADLDAGRWNAFVAAVSPGAQDPEARDRHRAATYVAMLTADAVAACFGRIDEGLLRSAAIADTLSPPVPPLADHLRRFAGGLREQGAAVQERYRALGERAANLLLSASVDAHHGQARDGHVYREEIA
jgi:hypothetical protein